MRSRAPHPGLLAFRVFVFTAAGQRLGAARFVFSQQGLERHVYLSLEKLCTSANGTPVTSPAFSIRSMRSF